MDWNLEFISEKDFTEHVKSTIENTARSWNHMILSGLTKILSIRLR